MDRRIDQTSTIVVEGTTETLKAHVDEIQATGGRIVQVRAVAPARSGGLPDSFEIEYTEATEPHPASMRT